ncbi:DUF1850 domain-containing protein [Cohnella sp. CFH 77786]|uniref:DUF1850 domain-containing protein n=1 Tax=Cohnella sp. CFH 77786 TaxID=2662265 RepID=UPI001C610044|nr:DUF1850 domain-containing protein [Cohnella sp. CFH 77786]MBW5446092.1 DUF1850 domain-containing protein [Cohnella sp. CFH 77786]
MIGETERVRGRAPAPVFHRKGLGLILFAAAILASLWLWASSIPVLTIRQVTDGRIVFQSPADQGSRFSLVYIHSIHRTPVEEFFIVNERRQIVLDSVAFESYGVGMPTSLEGHETFRMADGKLRIENMDRTLETFDLRIGQVIANHRLRIREREIPLSQLSEPGSAVRFEIERLHVWHFLKGGLRFDR